MRLFVHWQSLKPPRTNPNLTTKKNQYQLDTPVIHQDPIDLRGMRTSDAIEKLELALDKAQLNNLDRVKIIHGRGTDVLKKTVRSHLSRSIYVNRWQISPLEDGVTFAYLKGD